MDYLTPADFEIAAKNNIPEKLAYRRYYHEGWSKRRSITQTPRGRTLWDQFKDICKENGISRGSFYDRVNNQKMTPEDAATTPKNTNPKVTEETVKIAEANGICRKTLEGRVYNLKWTVERAVTDPVKKKHRRKDLGNDGEKESNVNRSETTSEVAS